MIVVADVHGLIKPYLRILDRYPDQHVIQLGDMGYGFPKIRLPPLRPKHRWFCGNHDDPKLSATHPNNLGRFGIWEGVFFVSGAFSIDAADRTPGIDWWADEQLSREEMEECLDLYTKTKPSVVIAHDIPISLYPEAIISAHGKWARIFENSTAHFLEALINVHQPDLWVAGHWHTHLEVQKGKTKYVILNELETYEIPSLKPPEVNDVM